MGALSGTDFEKRETIVSRNPATAEVLGEVREQSAAEIRDAVARARAAQVAWGAMPVETRAKKLGAFRDAIVLMPTSCAAY